MSVCPCRRPYEDKPDVYEYMCASESGALTALGFEAIGDVPPAHCLLLKRGEKPVLHKCTPEGVVPAPRHTPCVFEYVYFARPDSVLDGVSVYRTRLRMGEMLAQQIRRKWADHDMDVVVPVSCHCSPYASPPPPFSRVICSAPFLCTHPFSPQSFSIRYACLAPMLFV